MLTGRPSPCSNGYFIPGVDVSYLTSFVSSRLVSFPQYVYVPFSTSSECVKQLLAFALRNANPMAIQIAMIIVNIM